MTRLLFLLLIPACAPPPGFVVTVDTLTAPSWLDLDPAIVIWAGRGVTLLPTPDGQVGFTVETMPPDRSAEFRATFARNSGVIALDPSLSDPSRASACVVAHEFGHALHLNHVTQGPSLMAPAVTFAPDGGCFWSELDEQQFCDRNTDMCAAQN